MMGVGTGGWMRDNEWGRHGRIFVGMFVAYLNHSAYSTLSNFLLLLLIVPGWSGSLNIIVGRKTV